MIMSYSNYEQTVIIDGYKLLGVQSVDGNYGISEKSVKIAGVGFVDCLVSVGTLRQVDLNYEPDCGRVPSKFPRPRGHLT